MLERERNMKVPLQSNFNVIFNVKIQYNLYICVKIYPIVNARVGVGVGKWNERWETGPWGEWELGIGEWSRSTAEVVGGASVAVTLKTKLGNHA